VKKSALGSLAIILGGLVLSLEIYSLKFIQGVEMQTGSWKTYASDYATEMPMFLALCITLAIIIYGIVLVIKAKETKE
jgi:hypothetical protein